MPASGTVDVPQGETDGDRDRTVCWAWRGLEKNSRGGFAAAAAAATAAAVAGSISSIR